MLEAIINGIILISGSGKKAAPIKPKTIWPIATKPIAIVLSPVPLITAFQIACSAAASKTRLKTKMVIFFSQTKIVEYSARPGQRISLYICKELHSFKNPFLNTITRIFYATKRRHFYSISRLFPNIDRSNI